MSLKKLLHLEDFPLTEREIIAKIEDAQVHHQSSIEFVHGKRHVVIKINECSTNGLMGGDVSWGG